MMTLLQIKIVIEIVRNAKATAEAFCRSASAMHTFLEILGITSSPKGKTKP